MYYILTILILALFIWILGKKNFFNEKHCHALTIREIMITILCSLSPIILDCVIKSCTTQYTFWYQFTKSFAKGEIFLYTSAYLSTFFVLYIKDTKKTPGYILFCVFFSLFVGAAIYSFDFMGKNLGIQLFIPEGALSLFEVLIIICVLIVWYWSALPNNKSCGNTYRNDQIQQNELKIKFKEHKGR